MNMKRPPLYHLTAEEWWILIAQTGQIYSRLDKERHGLAKSSGVTATSTLGGQIVQQHYPRVHPDDVVIDGLIWLTQNPAPTQQWQEPVEGPLGKGGILIEVEVPEAQRWEPFMRTRNPPLDRKYMAALSQTGGRNQAGLWWVTPGPIPQERWVKVTRTRDGLVLYDRGTDG